MSNDTQLDLSDSLGSGEIDGVDARSFFLNRDLAWLQFNRRVLHEAMDERNPVLERVRFMAIFTSNLDEFFMKRVGNLQRQARTLRSGASTADGRTPQQVLDEIRLQTAQDVKIQEDHYVNVLRPELRECGVHLCPYEELTEAERAIATKYYHQNVFAVLTPLAVDPGSPFPFISNLSLSLGILLKHEEKDDPVFARVKVPEVLPKWVRVSPPGEAPIRLVAMHDLIRNHLNALFPDMAILSVTAFRVTRNAEIEMAEHASEDVREVMEAEVKQRRFAEVVRLEHGSNPDPWMLAFLRDALKVSDANVYQLTAEVDYEDLKAVADLNLPHLRFIPWTPIVPPILADEATDIFSVIRRGDLLVHHPYESFDASVGRFIETAAVDPKVLAIKMTLYRTSESTHFIKTLIRAAEEGKQVVVLVELKARFDEERNLKVAQALEEAGAHVVYGVVGLKTHTKTTLIVRDEPEGIRCYTHIGTGNYNAATARLYTDVGLFTCNDEITRDIVELFHYLTGRSANRTYRRLLVAPVNMRQRVLELIHRETEHARAGRPARIVAKMNAMEDRRVARALYAASQSGVEIDLLVRGFCTLRPGVAGMSERIRVTSVIGRFLEHSRIFYFRNGAADEVDGEFFIGSADWMYRNLLARVEAAVPIDNRTHRQRLWQILQTMLADQRQAWDMQPDGSYVQRRPSPPPTPASGSTSANGLRGGGVGATSAASAEIGTHATLMNLALAATRPMMA